MLDKVANMTAIAAVEGQVTAEEAVSVISKVMSSSLLVSRRLARLSHSRGV